MTLEEQPVPSDTRCPYCGGQPSNEVEHRLSALGYTHDDVVLNCEDCNREWWCGVPIGEPDDEFWQDLWCASCDESLYRVKALELPQNGTVHLHVKCPVCNYVPKKKPQRDIHEQKGVHMVMIGFPDVTGSFDGAEPKGWSK